MPERTSFCLCALAFASNTTSSARGIILDDPKQNAVVLVLADDLHSDGSLNWVI